MRMLHVCVRVCLVVVFPFVWMFVVLCVGLCVRVCVRLQSCFCVRCSYVAWLRFFVCAHVYVLSFLFMCARAFVCCVRVCV